MGVEPDHVLVPLDGSPLAEDALEHALAVFDCRVTVLNVVTPLDADMAEGGILGSDDGQEAGARERAERLVERARERATVEGRTIETVVETGDPADVIVDYVERHDVDHVVMGSHSGKRGRITRRLLGTVTTAVLGNVDVTVTVVQ
ncbi:universal stress protein [Halorubrum vacuolatum]|uniref:Nucleotide-binding universal stress protein, UspA family n=1 Tax=Halorubrum vacuolatum TaxID=63740 RepID=A0A238UUT6_HALVU|nr:universal stress protein [Halorubrum vacuolatum]SNR25009.1 Nucleotide-binding universal stress protein, UspA family [Halorubrum vacuolatum]